jgi:hypothetical protein
LLRPPGPPGNRGRSSVIPARPCSGGAPEGLGTARFSSPLELKKRRSARCPQVAALVQLYPPPTTAPRPAGGSHCLGYLGITWGGLVATGGWQPGATGPPEGPIACARQPFHAPRSALTPSSLGTKKQETQGRGGTGHRGPGGWGVRVRGPGFVCVCVEAP